MEPVHVLVTGGGRGIGRAIALRFAAEGARVAVAARTPAELDSVVAEIEAAGGRGLAQVLDQGDPGSIERAVAAVLAAFGGRLDVLVNNAGIFDVRPIGETDREMWERFVAVNLTGPYLVTLAALPALLESRGHVFQIASTAARQGFAGSAIYCATKAGLMGLANGMREDLREAGVRVSTVYPGGTDTSIFDDVPGDWDRSAMNRPEDVAEVVWKGYRGDGDQADLSVPPPGA